MNKTELFKEIKARVHPSRGLSMVETEVLMGLPRVDVRTSRLNEGEIVEFCKKIIYEELRRKNITAKDMRNAIVGLLVRT